MAKSNINHPEPIGTLDELKANPFWKPNEWHTCAAPDERNGIAGCPAWADCPFTGGRVYDCDLPEMKGVSGPHNLGVQQIMKKWSNGQPKLVNAVLPCWGVPKRARQLELRGGVLLVIGMEGEEIEESGSLPEDSMIPGQGPVRIYKAQTCKRKIPKFPRPTENPVLYASSFAAEQAKKFAERQRVSRTGQLFGSVTTSTKPEGESGKRGGPRG
jgi:hypothetical protein